MVQFATLPNEPHLSPLRARRRDELYRRAVDLIRRRGFDACSIDDIADHAGISRRSFFNYFPSKSALLVHLHAQVTERVLDVLDRPAETPPGALPRVRSALLQFAVELEHDRHLLRALYARVHSEADLRVQDEADSSSAVPRFAVALDEAKNSGELGSTVDSSDAARFLLSVVNGALSNWALQSEPTSATLHDLLSQRIGWALTGLSAELTS